jgi:2-isopropylmalate synthase
MWDIFAATYLAPAAPRLVVEDYATATVDGLVELTASVRLRGQPAQLRGTGNGPIDAFVHALSGVGIAVTVRDYAEHAMTAGGDATAAAYVECEVDGDIRWGVGISANIVTASITAVASAANRT